MTTTPSVAAASPVTWRLWVGPLVWAAHFLAIYGFTALACERNVTASAFGVGIVIWFIGIATLLAVLALGITIWLAVREGRSSASLPAPFEFMRSLTLAIATLAMLAVVWEALPLIFLPICT